MSRKAIFIAATGQNVGKTTICLGLIAALKKRIRKLGFIKPVGQQHQKVNDHLLVDKDVVLFKEYFSLSDEYADMSPVIFPKGFTRDYLDQKISEKLLKEKILQSFGKISSQSDFTIVEGTGHVGVGSIVNLNNAIVANLLNLDIILIVEGGLGSTFDELALNKTLCDTMNVKIAGVILNRVIEEKKEMVNSYIQKALDRWDIPLIGSVPYDQFLSTPTMEDFETLFATKLISGQQFHYCHFKTIRLVATSVERFRERLFAQQLIVTPATREDIVLTIIANEQKHPVNGLILTGRYPPTPSLRRALEKSNIPSLYAAHTSYEAMRMINSFTAKIRKGDTQKVEKAITLVEENFNLSLI